jgi:taspase (threonine aspartase 1)
MKNACKAAAGSLASTDCPLAAVTAAIKTLEDDALTNAGNGSNLTMDGFVECDASVMAGDGTYGSIAAAAGVKNPCAAATKLALDSREPLSHGRVRPVMLAGDAARVWAVQQGLEAAYTAEAAREMHVTEKACCQHKKYSNILKTGNPETESNPKKRQRIIITEDGADLLNDTVGCCVVTASGKTASAVSSGGIAMKTSGRVGEAAVYGAGCWSEESEETKNAVAVSVTGVGERIMKHLVARECGKLVLGGSINRNSDPLTLCTNYLRETIGTGPPPRDCGVLCASTQKQPGYLHVALTAVHLESESMAVAWLSEDSNGILRSESRILRKSRSSNNSNNAGGLASQSLVVGLHWHLEDNTVTTTTKKK